MTDPILAAKDIAELMAAIDTVYGLDLPTSMPAGSTLAVLWAATITVTTGSRPGVAYDALGTGPISLPPAPPATVFVRVDDPGEPHDQQQARTVP